MAEHLLFGLRRPRERVFHPRMNNLIRLDDVDIKKRYRLTKDVAKTLVDDLREDLSKCGRSRAVSPEIQAYTGTSLWNNLWLMFYATFRRVFPTIYPVIVVP
ncbi:hypothetical protein LOTGIDRAFT_172783 [Lottia gigantea]|uniref:Uncharacterized protein n=1 Tax=Lottia gigantea TaxID=225164 RepID=V4B587_LOTGI|nr:hypothetical protein LOTGIDRAFT_172783 [Lottia gigantea]ESP01152.1 hypothetical protein LOTGIDRAFT_172783 [Lottia gigantea]